MYIPHFNATETQHGELDLYKMVKQPQNYVSFGVFSINKLALVTIGFYKVLV